MFYTIRMCQESVFKESKLQGFIILESCGGSKATIFTSENKQVFEEIVDFLDKGGNFNKEYSIYCSENNLLETELLCEHKYNVVGYPDTTFEYCVEDIVFPVVDLPDVEIEVVCTKKEEEGKGYAKAVIAECIRRSIEMGARKVNISGWNELTKHLYSSFGKHTTVQKLEFRK